MTNEAYVFNETNRERAILKRSAYCKKGGSRSKSCKLGVDKMSRKEIEAQHGPVQSWKMTEFYTWDEFKSMPDDIKIEYLNYIVDNYHVSVGAIESFLFNVGTATLYKFLKRKDLLVRVHNSGTTGHAASKQVREFKKAIEYARYPTTPEDTNDLPEVKEEPIHESSINMLKLSTDYISDKIDYKNLEAMEKFFSGQKIHVSIAMELA